MILYFDGIGNARDLGGIPTVEGRRVKPGRLLRSARLDKAGDGDVARLQEGYALRHIVDFRDRDEVKHAPDRSIPGAVWYGLPALPPFAPGEPGQPRRREPRDFDQVFRRIYRELAETDVAAGAYREFFRILLKARGESVLWHCTQGKDRTGVAALLLLSALGVEEERAMEDYFLSNTGADVQFARFAEEKGLDEAGKETWEKLFFVYPDFVNVFVDSVNAAYGGMMGYIQQRLGITEAEIQALRACYTE